MNRQHVCRKEGNIPLKLHNKKKWNTLNIVVFVILMVYALTLLYPFLYLLLGSLNDSWGFMQDPLGVPEKVTFENFKSVFYNMAEVTGMESLSLQSMFFNSITLALGLTVVSVMLQSMVAYVLAKYDFRGNRLLYMTIIVSSMIPTVGALTATFKLMNQTHLTGTYLGMILLQASAFGGQFLHMHAYYKSIPWTYGESAMIDGASDLQIYFRIMMPLAKKALSTYFVLTFLGFWNDYWLPSLFYEQRPTLAVGLNHISVIATGTGNYPLLFAAMLVTIIPVLLLFAVFQKQMLGNVTGGGIKE